MNESKKGLAEGGSIRREKHPCVVGPTWNNICISTGQKGPESVSARLRVWRKAAPWCKGRGELLSQDYEWKKTTQGNSTE